MDKNLSAVVVNWLTARRTLGTIQSIRKYYPHLFINIVDDGSVESDRSKFRQVYGSYDKNDDQIYQPDLVYDPDNKKLKNIPGTRFIQVPTHRRHGEALDYALPLIENKWLFHLDSDTRIIKPEVIEYMVDGVTDKNCSIGIQRLQHGMVHPDYPQISGCIFIFRNDLYEKYNLKMEPIYESLLGPMTAYHHFLTKKGYKIKYLPKDEIGQYYVHLRWSGEKGKDEWNRYF